ncbi:MAG: hypothetical protein QG675_142 [Patescibacteria group bacterium]|jgi:hypothetical protein|nr:hypothetical protein [Patescibacteria group bacterium]
MSNKDKQLELQQLADQMHAAEESLEQVQKLLKKMGVSSKDLPKPNKNPQPTVSVPRTTEDTTEVAGKIIEGHFDGQNMIGPDGKTYPVPANYASKSKLVEGDTLKLTIAPDGSFIYKQIGPIERKKLIAKLGLESGQYIATVGENQFRVLYASVTYFKAQPGDEVTIVIPAHGEANWAAIEAVIGN